MHLLNILWQKRANLVIIALALVAIIPVTPIIKTGKEGVFFNMDPEMALVGNALSYTQNRLIHYRDHPGTPTIMFISKAFLPLRLITKFIVGENFISWSFDNLRFIFLYVRLIMIASLAISVYVFLASIKKISQSIWIIVFAWLSLFSFSFTPRLGGAVLTENLSFLLISLWLWFFAETIKKVNPLTLVVMSFLSGLAIANKYNNFPILFITLLLTFWIIGLKFRQKVYNLMLNSIVAVSGFIIGTFPIRRSYVFLVKQVSKVIFQSGEGAAHGVSNSSFFNLDSYLLSLSNYYAAERIPSILMISLLILMIIFLVFRKRSRFSINSWMVLVCLLMVLSIIFISKYPLSYYQFPNYLLIIFLLSFYLSKIDRRIVAILCIAIFPFTITNLNNYKQQLVNNIKSSNYLENFIKTNPPEHSALWDYGPTEDFMKIWIRGWSGGIYDSELKDRRPDILELKSDYKTVYLDANRHLNVFDACWDKLYIRKDRAVVFLEIYKDKKFEAGPIGDTGIWEINSDHCSTKTENY